MNYYKCVCKFIDMYVFIWPRLESGPPGEPGDTDHDHQVSAQTIVAVPGVAINKIRHLNNSRARPDPQTRRSDDTVRSSAAITTLQRIRQPVLAAGVPSAGHYCQVPSHLSTQLYIHHYHIEHGTSCL